MIASFPETILGLFCAQVAAHPDRMALLFRKDGEPVERTWAQLRADVRKAAGALTRHGVRPGDRVVLFSPNRYEWIVADLAIQMVQAASVPVHNALAAGQVLYQIVDSGAQVALLAGVDQVRRLAPCAADLPRDLQLIVFDPLPPGEALSAHALAACENPADAAEIGWENSALSDTGPESLATLIYTSGTTGEPKGVMLSQSNLAGNARASCALFGVLPGDRRLNWLPLSHIFARTCDLYIWLAARDAEGHATTLALAEGPDTVLACCEVFHPTLLNGVPYFFEKVCRYAQEHPEGASLAELLGGRLRAGCSGGAPLPDHVARMFAERGVVLVQGYGLTETSPVISAGTLTESRLGTVGRALADVEVRIAADGEILTKGPHVMQGYWNKPGATAEAIRAGWFHTGDLGEIDSDGYLKITGRKKELIVTSGGKNIAPNYLECLLTEDPWIQQAVVIGDRRSYLTALVVANLAAVRSALSADSRQSPESLLELPQVQAWFLERVQARLKDVSHFEQVRKIRLLATPFSIEQGELTPTLKLRRTVIAERYASLIESMYAAG